MCYAVVTRTAVRSFGRANDFASLAVARPVNVCFLMRVFFHSIVIACRLLSGSFQVAIDDARVCELCFEGKQDGKY